MASVVSESQPSYAAEQENRRRLDEMLQSALDQMMTHVMDDTFRPEDEATYWAFDDYRTNILQPQNAQRLRFDEGTYERRDEARKLFANVKTFLEHYAKGWWNWHIEYCTCKS